MSTTTIKKGCNTKLFLITLTSLICFTAATTIELADVYSTYTIKKIKIKEESHFSLNITNCVVNIFSEKFVMKNKS